MTLHSEGWSKRAIANRLVLAVRTVESHTWAIFLKLGAVPDDRVNRRVLLARVWLEHAASGQAGQRGADPRARPAGLT